MKIAYLNLERKYKNIAIEKIKKYHLSRGDEVEEYIELFHFTYDKIYVSSIFTDTDKSQIPIGDNVTYGGTGFDLTTKLPKEIDDMKLKINFGFTTRGCIRNCKFCVVPIKEGSIHAVGDIYDLWDGESKEITLLDNNILALPDHFKLICEQVKKENLKIDFNQGLDIRLLDHDIAKLLGGLRRDKYHFAFDFSAMDSVIKDNVKTLQSNGIKESIFYVLVGYPNYPGESVKGNIEDAMYRLKLLKSLGQNAYVMRYRRVYEKQPKSLITDDTRKPYIALANWGNVRQAFHGMDFYSQYLNHEKGKPYKRFYQELGLVS